MKKKLLLGLLILGSVFALTACKNDTKKAYKVEWTVPIGFSTKDDKMYYSSEYPLDASNIVFSKSENTMIDPEATDVEIEVELQKNMYKILATEVEVDVTVFEEIELDGFRGLHIEAQCVYEGIEMTQICYMYDCKGDCYSIAYTFQNDKDWEVLFRESAASIRIVETEAKKEK